MKYFLAESCQNSFVLFDCLESFELDETFMKKALSILRKEDRDDALILMNCQSHNSSLIVQMVVLGFDGEIAEFCGNGARAVAAYLFSNGFYSKEVLLQTKQGKYPIAACGGCRYSIKLSFPCFEWNFKFIKDKRQLNGFTYVEVGEPHLIISKKMNDDELMAIGRNLNRQKDVFPFGINVNAWHVLQDGHIFVKTYERGVQRLTKSCGSGSVACAAFYQKKGTVHVTTPGGILEILIQDFGVELCGESFITKTVTL